MGVCFVVYYFVQRAYAAAPCAHSYEARVDQAMNEDLHKLWLSIDNIVDHEYVFSAFAALGARNPFIANGTSWEYDWEMFKKALYARHPTALEFAELLAAEIIRLRLAE